MTHPVSTLQGTVNTWNCDEVGHMNVQFYFAAGADAARVYAASKKVSGAVYSQTDHVRFHRELRAGDIFNVTTLPVGTHDSGLILAHQVINRGTGELSATIVSNTSLPAGMAEDRFGDIPEAARPRSIAARSSLPALTLNDPVAEKLIPIYQGVVHADQCNEAGAMRQQFIMSRFSDGAAHLWHHVGFDRDAMLKARRGTVVLETRLDRLTDVRAGTVLIARSAIVEIMDKVLRFAHFLFDGSTGSLVATGEAAAVLLDLDARKTVAFGEAERAGLAPYLLEF